MSFTLSLAVLIPLFGLHNLLSAFMPENGTLARKCLELVSAISISFQGMIIAILFCFMNSEVIFQLKKLFGTRFNSNLPQQSMAMTQYTVSKFCPHG